MGNLVIDEIVKATGGRVLCVNQSEFTGLSIDSRTTESGELFLALRGVNFDGHDFIRNALEKASGAVVSLPPVEPVRGKTIIYVKNTLSALHDIARYLRSKMQVPVIGITGTNGKTTTKELVASILGSSHKVLKTSGNLNNHIGLPLCMSNMDGNETVMVLEMGSNTSGDIKQLCDIAKPGFAVVTNVGPAHLEGFGSLEMVRDTDLEILEYAKVAAVNADDLFLLEGVKGFTGKAIKYGIDNPADVYAKDIVLKDKGSSFRLCFSEDKTTEINLQLSGKFNIYNALAAASITAELGVGADEIKYGMEGFSGVPMRIEIKNIFGAVVISDVYNANPASMEEAVNELVRLKGVRAIAVLGDMLELGHYAEEAHRKLVRRLSQLNIEILIAVGPEMTRASEEFSGTCYRTDNAVAAGAKLQNICRQGDTVLVKGSRGMQMEKALPDSVVREDSHAL